MNLKKSIATSDKTVSYIIERLIVILAKDYNFLINIRDDAKGLIKAKLPYFNANGGNNIKTILDDLCFEYGYVYFFDNSGNFGLRELFNPLDDIYSIKQVFDGSNMRDKIDVKVKPKECDYVKADYEGTENVVRGLVLSDTQNGNAYDKCQIAVKSKDYIFGKKT